jgi:hypothetical protein
MAERQFIIRIVNDTEGGAGQSVGGAGGLGNKAGGSSKKTSNDGGAVVDKIEKRLAKMVAPAALIRGSKSIVDQVVQHNNSLIEIRTGSKEQQQRTSFIYNTTSGFVGGGLSGAMTGLVLTGGNPAGAAIGALVGIVQQGATMGINYLKQADILREQRNLETMQQNLAAQRVTISGSRYMNASQM